MRQDASSLGIIGYMVQHSTLVGGYQGLSDLSPTPVIMLYTHIQADLITCSLESPEPLRMDKISSLLQSLTSIERSRVSSCLEV